MSRIIEVIRQVVRQELAGSRGSLLGVVTAVFAHGDKDDENNYEASVRLKHEDLELQRVPIAVPNIGIAAPPCVGDLVLVQFANADLNQPLITGRFYHADERPPLHKENEFLFEQRVGDGTLNHLRFTDDGTIYLQRDVTKPEDNSEAKTGIKIDGASGDMVIKSGDKITITVTKDKIDIVADGKEITMTCKQLTVTGDAKIDGKTTITRDTEVQGTFKVSGATGSTTIKGNEIQGG